MDKYDRQGMYKAYERWPDMAAESYRIHERIDPADIDHIVFAGMGGSGTVGDVFASILSKKDIHVSNVKGYLLPKTVDSNTLVVATSVSGNTDETLTLLRSAAEAECEVVAASSGGAMEEFCSKNGTEYRRVEMTHSPRASLASYLYSLAGILEPVLPVSQTEIDESIRTMRDIRDVISTGSPDECNPSLRIAGWIRGIPIVYYPSGLQSVAVRFKNSLQENAKRHAFAEDVIEACHNGIVPWERESGCQPILIRGRDDYVKTKERWDILGNYFASRGIEFYAVDSVEGGILSKVMNLTYMLDFASIYLAVMSGIDPTPVISVNHIKSKMRS